MVGRSGKLQMLNRGNWGKSVETQHLMNDSRRINTQFQQVVQCPIEWNESLRYGDHVDSCTLSLCDQFDSNKGRE